MGADPRVDAYIAKAAPFAQPILRHLRHQVHAACADVEETLKWQMPFFTYKGKPLCNMAAFKAHCTFGFWNGALVVSPTHDKSSDAMGQFGRLARVEDLPAARTLQRYVKAAARLIDEGVPRRAPAARKKAAPRTPAELGQALADNARAGAAFEALSPSHRREYIEWIAEAKTAPTRARRVQKTVEWVGAGRPLNWKYEAGPRTRRG